MRGAILGMVLACMQPATLAAQEISGLSETEQKYVTALSTLLDMWEGQDIAFDRVAFDAQFPLRFATFEQRSASDPLDQAISADFIQENAKKLPDKVFAELPLTSGARLSLLASIADAADELQEQGVEPSALSLQSELPFALYATLGAAQEDAKLQGKAEIDSVSVKRGGVWFFSMGWPFCCAVMAPQ